MDFNLKVVNDEVIGSIDCNCDKYKRLKDIDKKTMMELGEFNLINTFTIGKVYYVYDGDTIRVCCWFNNNMYRINVRLDGFDTPELRCRDKTEKNAGYVARDWLRKLLTCENETDNGQLVWLHCKDYDKYGRLLGDIYLIKDTHNINDTIPTTKDKTNCVNDLIVENGYAVKYSGGSKADWPLLIKNKGYPLTK